MNNDIKKTVKTFIKQYKLTHVDYVTLKNTVEKAGYTIIEFNGMLNEKAVETVIENLNLTENVLKSRGFTYESADYRLVFVNEALSNEEKMIVLSHELGHIICGHSSNTSVIGKDVKEEHEANEFSHYLLRYKKPSKIKNIMTKHRKFFVVSLAALCLAFVTVTAYFVAQNQEKYTDNLYITSTGGAYHRKECIFVKNKTNVKKLTKLDFENRSYSPCDMCLPDKN